MKGDVMKVKKYLCITAIVTISVCTVVFGLPFFTDNTIVDALTRPSEETASMLLGGVKSVWVEIEIRSNVRSNYEQLSSKNLSTEIEKQLKEKTDVVINGSWPYCRILADIQLKGKKETEFVAADISVSFAEQVRPERFSEYYFPGITWQSRKTLLIRRDEVSEEVPKHLGYLVMHLCRYLPHTKMTEKAVQEWRKGSKNKK
jgi:hypothetical protein